MRIAFGSDTVTILAGSYGVGRYAISFGSGNSVLGKLTLGEANSETLTGSAQQDLLIGGGGNDILVGEAGEDYLEGGVGNDILVGGEGSDTYIFSAGDSGTGTLAKDVIEDGGGKIVFLQGSGNDYNGATYTYTFDSDGARLTVEKDGARLNLIEFLGVTADSFSFYTSDETAETQLDPANFVGFIAGDGSESSPFLATDRTETFIGFEGADWVSYANADSEGVVVDLETGAVERTYATGDTFSGIENVIGSDYDDVLTGNTGDNILRGEVGDDILYGGSGNDQLAGGAGSDTYMFNAGDGTDTVAEVSGTNNIVFTALTGDLAANSQRANLQRLSFAEVGSDLEISIDSDGDGTFGGADDDKVILAGVFSDERPQSELHFNLYGGSYDPDNSDSNLISRLFIGKTVDGNSIRRDNHHGIMYGGSGNDRLTGGYGDGMVYGGEGNDRLAILGSGGGKDLLDGGAGEDTYHISHFSWFDNDFTIRDQDNAGIVNFDFGHYGSGMTIDNFRRVNDDLEITYSNFSTSYVAYINVTTITIEDYYAAGSNFIMENLAGWSSTLKTSVAALVAVRDDDSAVTVGVTGTGAVFASINPEYFSGGEGENTVSYAYSGSPVVADLQMLTTNIGGLARGDTYAGIEKLIGSEYDDVLLGDDQVNHLVGGAGNDFLQGRMGNDIIDGGDGSDTVSYEGETTGIILTLGEGSAAADFTRIDSSEQDFITNVEGVFGSDARDIITGNATNNRLYGGGGRDEIYGGDGDDHLYGESYDHYGLYLHDEDAGGNADDRLYGGDGNDWLYGNYGNDFLDGGDGNDYLIGGSGDDTSYGGAGNDYFNGGDGNDIFDGGEGNDKFHGGAGRDTYLFRAGDGTDKIYDEAESIAGMVSVVLRFEGSDYDQTDFDSASVVRSGNNLVLRLDVDDDGEEDNSITVYSVYRGGSGTGVDGTTVAFTINIEYGSDGSFTEIATDLWHSL